MKPSEAVRRAHPRGGGRRRHAYRGFRKKSLRDAHQRPDDFRTPVFRKQPHGLDGGKGIPIVQNIRNQGLDAIPPFLRRTEMKQGKTGMKRLQSRRIANPDFYGIAPPGRFEPPDRLNGDDSEIHVLAFDTGFDLEDYL